MLPLMTPRPTGIESPAPAQHLWHRLAGVLGRTLACLLVTAGSVGWLRAQEHRDETPAPGAQSSSQSESHYDFDALRQALAAAHRGAEQLPAVHGFAADLRVQELARESAQRIEVELKVRFLDLLDDATGKRKPLIRYQQIDSARTVEFGRDETYYWGNLTGRAEYLTAKEFEADRLSVRRNLKLARQLIAFLDPDQVLGQLTQPSAVQSERLTLGRALDETCRTVRGRLAKFPLRQSEGEDAPVDLKVFVDGNNMLLAVEALPVPGDGKEPTGNGEFLWFSDYRAHEGRQVPMRVRYYSVDDRGARRQQVVVDLTTLNLAPELQADDFARPKQ